MKEFFKKLFDAAPTIDFGHGYVARRLTNGKWVLEVKSSGSLHMEAVDFKSPLYNWNPSSSHYKDCMVSKLTLLRKTNEILARKGI